MPFHIVLAAVAVGCSIPLFFWAIGSEKEFDRARGALADAGRSTGYGNVRLNQSIVQRVLRPLTDSAASVARRITPIGWVGRLEKKINRAGANSSWTVERLMAFQLLLGVPVAIIMTLRWLASPTLPSLVFGAALTATAFLSPGIVLSKRADDRDAQIRESLADVVDQITIAVEAGLSFDAALARVASRSSGPLSVELNRVLQDIGFGMSRRNALQALLERSDVPELREFILALTQAEGYGLSIGSVLRTQSQEQRLKRKQRAEERAHKMPVKMTIPLVFCLLPCVLIVVMGPAVVRLLEISI